MEPKKEDLIKEEDQKKEAGKTDSKKDKRSKKPKRFNDGAWYTQNGAIDLIGTNLGNKTGKPVALSNLNLIVPTVGRFETIVSIPRGKTTNNAEWANAIKQMYVDIRGANTGRAPYTAADLEKYIINTRAYYIMLEHMIRVAKATSTNNVYKKLYRDRLIQACGLDAADITSYADQWATFKTTLRQELKSEPENYPVIGALYERDRFLYENIFKTEKGYKAATFAFTARVLPYFTIATGMESMDIACDTPDDLLAKYWTIKEHLDATPNIDEIVKEIRKATGMYTVMSFDINGIDNPLDAVFDLAFAEQIQNAFMIKPNIGNATAISYNTYNGFVNMSIAIEAKLDDTSGDSINNSQCYNDNVTITTQFDHLSGVDIIERTRFKCGGALGGAYYFISVRCTDLILNARLYYADDWDYIFNNITAGAAAKLSTQEHMPYVYLYQSGTVYSVFYDLDQYGQVNIEDLENYHDIATASLLKATKLRAIELVNSYLHRNS